MYNILGRRHYTNHEGSEKIETKNLGVNFFCLENFFMSATNVLKSAKNN